MSKNLNRYSKLKNLIYIWCLSLLVACASVQSPTGGPKDIKPPKVVKETPQNLTRNFASKTITLSFDEFIKLNNEANEVSISPALERFPTFKIRKHNLDITFEDTLETNTTYTINFGKAIGDVNENNILTNYTYVFSTGNTIDSLSISGQVTSSVSQETLKDVTVFILPTRQDTLFGKRRASIFTSTDSAGNFKLSNLREDTYRIYALQEQSGGDRIYNSINEEIGFLGDSIHLTKDTSNIKLQVFKQEPEKLAVSDTKIENDGRITLAFNKLADVPTVKIIEPALLNNKQVSEFTTNKDSVLLWIPDMSFDSLKVELSDNRKPVDTVILRRNKRDTYSRNISITDNLTSGRLKPGANLILTTSTPIAGFNSQVFSLLQDSVPVQGVQTARVEGSQRKFSISFPWRTERNYELRIGEGAFTDIYSANSKAATKKLVLDDSENYGNLAIRITPPDTTTTLLVQLLTADDKILRTDSVPPSRRLNYSNYPTNKYNIRVIYDTNKNGKWDTGSFKGKRQPERIYNHTKTLTLRPNWDLEEIITVPPIQ